MTLDCQSFAPGTAEAVALVLSEPLSFWGGIDVETGRVIDRSHADLGRTVSGKILVMPGARGSSSSSSILAECLRRRTGPAAIVLATPDPILVVGAIVAGTLYGLECPIVVAATDAIVTGMRVRVRAAVTGRSDVTVIR